MPDDHEGFGVVPAAFFFLLLILFLITRGPEIYRSMVKTTQVQQDCDK